MLVRLPVELTWNWDEAPTLSIEAGDVVPIPTLPLVVNVLKRPVLGVVEPIVPGLAHGMSDDVTVPVVILSASRLGISVAASAAHAGAAANVPLPVPLRNCLVAVVLPARRVPVPDAPPYKMSPNVVIDDSASNAAEAVVAPVPPFATDKVPLVISAAE